MLPWCHMLTISCKAAASCRREVRYCLHGLFVAVCACAMRGAQIVSADMHGDAVGCSLCPDTCKEQWQDRSNWMCGPRACLL